MSGVPIESAGGMPINPNSVIKLDMLPPQSGVEVLVDYYTHTVKFRPYYLTMNHPNFGSWTQDYDMDDAPIELTWVGLWPKGNPLDN